MRIINLKQGSQEWLDFRKTHITATDVAVINGTNKFKSVHKLLGQKLGVVAPEADNERMAEGRRLEEEARILYNFEYKTSFEPLTAESEEYPWIMASLDGYYNGCTLEIKCGEKSYLEAQNGVIAKYYYDQLQAQMFVAGTETAIFACYRPNMPLIVQHVSFDKAYWKKVLVKLQKFWDTLQRTEVIEDQNLEMLAEQLKEAREKAKEWKDKEEAIKEQLSGQLPQGDCFCGCLTAQTISKKGLVDWKALCKQYDITSDAQDLFRKEDSSYRKFNII